jgi:GntR family transcriptional regulator
MIEVDPESTVPPYEQVRTRIASLAASGELAAGAKLPTVRHLAAELGLAVNTVARAYRELEADGVVVTDGRRGTFVRSEVVTSTPAAVDDLVRGFAAAARRHGLTCAEATRLVERAWSA